MSGRDLIFFAAALLWSFGQTSGFGAEGRVFPAPSREGVHFFERRIRPVLIEQCYGCHSASSGKAEGGVRLDSRQGLQQGGENGSFIVPGDPRKSRLIEIIRSVHPASRMPPKGGLARSTIADFETWVRMGAPDPRAGETGPPSGEVLGSEHWAFRPLRTPPIPGVRNAGWIQDPIDGFILARLEQENLRPAQAADRATLIRRATYDLVGLPPTPEQVDEFIADPSPRAFERVVDRLLNSAQFGEHWGRHWLGVAGYADLGGMDISAVHENAWRYRDYVIAALNADKPYDQFILEQLAGDLLPEENEVVDRERLIATGFLMVGQKLGSEPKRAKRILDLVDDQVELTTRAFLALTVACARCHDHKSDPIPIREYYSLAGIFISTTSLASGPDEPRRGPARWQERSLATTEQLREISAYETRFKELKEQLQEAREMKVAFPGDIDSMSLEGVVVDNLAAELHGAWKESNYSTNFVDRNYVHDGDADKGKKSARFVPDLPADGLYEVMISYTHRANRATNVPVTITGKDGTKKVFVNQTVPPTIDKAFTSIGKFKFSAGTSGSVQIANEGTKGFVVVDAVRFVPAEAADRVVTEADVASPETALLNYRQLEREFLEFRARRPVVPHAMAVRDGPIRACKLRIGGDPDQPAEEVPRGFLSVIGTPDSTLYAITDESSGRLELAYWLANPDNPLTARVAANRVWQHLFGRGLVRTIDDFGVLGDEPSHPELLDHLARRFIDGGWSLKKLVRSIILSRTYQLSSDPPPGALQKDAENQLFSRMDPRQLDPEALRDTALVLSRELQGEMGGSPLTNVPGLGPIQAARRAQETSRRRSVYLPVIRDFTAEVLRAFEVKPAEPASPSMAQPTKPSLSKNRFVSECSAAWAEVLLRGPVAADAHRISLAYRQALGRLPTTEETRQAAELLSATHTPGDPSNTLGWELVCQSILTSQSLRTRR